MSVAGMGASNVTNVAITITGDATDPTIEKMRQAAEQMFAEKAPGLVQQGTQAVEKRYRNEKNYLRR